MFNNISTKKLFIIFSILLIVVVSFMLYDSQQGESTFKTKIIDIDTSAVNVIKIYPKSSNHKEVLLKKEAGNWKVLLSNNKYAFAPSNKISGLLNQLLLIKPLSIAAKQKDKWADFQVDSTGTEVKLFDGNDKLLTLIVGKISFQQPRSVFTYVRVNDDDNVYQTEGFLSFVFDHDANYFRDQKIVSDNIGNWSKLIFNYPSGNSFVLTKKDGRWLLNGNHVDSTITENYLNKLSRLNASAFADNFDRNILNSNPYKLTIQSAKLGDIAIVCYKNNSGTIIHSSQNPEAYFDGTKNKLFESIFVEKKYFEKK